MSTRPNTYPEFILNVGATAPETQQNSHGMVAACIDNARLAQPGGGRYSAEMQNIRDIATGRLLQVKEDGTKVWAEAVLGGANVPPNTTGSFKPEDGYPCFNKARTTGHSLPYVMSGSQLSLYWELSNVLRLHLEARERACAVASGQGGGLMYGGPGPVLQAQRSVMEGMLAYLVMFSERRGRDGVTAHEVNMDYAQYLEAADKDGLAYMMSVFKWARAVCGFKRPSANDGRAAYGQQGGFKIAPTDSTPQVLDGTHGSRKDGVRAAVRHVRMWLLKHLPLVPFNVERALPPPPEATPTVAVLGAQVAADAPPPATPSRRRRPAPMVPAAATDEEDD